MADAGRGGARARRRWRHYRTATGRDPLAQFLVQVPEEDRGEVVSAMGLVSVHGKNALTARHLRGAIWEVRAQGARGSYRVLFAGEGARDQVLLALGGFRKQSQKTPRKAIELAEQRLSDWRRRGRQRRPPQR